MNKKTRNLTMSAIFIALCVVSLYIASVWPTGQLGIAAFASLFVAAAVIETGIGYGVSVFVVSSALCMLLIPNKIPPLLYVVFFGYYPVLKNIFERLGRVVLQWLFKLIVFNAALTLSLFLMKELFIGFTSLRFGFVVLYIAGNAVFAIFDYGYSKVVLFYKDRIYKRG